MTLTILNFSREHNFLRNVKICSQETWDAALEPFDKKVRWEAANMAAHNWDVFINQDRLFIIGPSSIGTVYHADKTMTKLPIWEKDHFYPRVEDETRHYMNDVICSYTEGNGSVWRERTLNLANFAYDGRRLTLMNKALTMHYEKLKDMPWVDFKGEPLDEERKKTRFINQLQKFWDELNKI